MGIPSRHPAGDAAVTPPGAGAAGLGNARNAARFVCYTTLGDLEWI